MGKIIWLVLGSIIVVAGLSVATVHPNLPVLLINDSLPNGAQFVQSDCWFETDNKHSVYCGWLHTSPAGKGQASAYQLPVVVIRYTGTGRQADPLVYLAGGPGSATDLQKREDMVSWFAWFDSKSTIKRDLILFDQRGNGLSKPALGCMEYRELNESILSTPGTPEENAGRYREATQQCETRLSGAKMPLHELGSAYSAQDVSDLLELLDYKQANLLGISYGTRLALEIQQRFPDKVRSLVLDSLYSPQEHLFRDWPELLGQGIERIFRYCNASDRCQLENGDLRERYQSLMAKLREKPLPVSVTHLHLGKLDTVYLNDQVLLSILFDAQYSSDNLPKLPTLIRHLQEGRVDLARWFVEDYLRHQFDDNFSEPVFWLVECNDNPAISRADMAVRADVYPELNYYLPPDANVCDIWNVGKQSALSPIKGIIDTPALILSGEDDPITPAARVGKAVETYFSRDTAYLFRFSHIAHNVLDHQPCANDLFVGFLNNPQERPSADCRFDRQFYDEAETVARFVE